MICTTAIAFFAVACGQQQPPAEEAPAEDAAAPSAVDEALTIESPEPRPMVNEAFIRHMHVHADQVDEIMLALSDNDLEGARGPAIWLSRHQEIEGIPDAWRPYLEGMREAASDLANAIDIEAARAAGDRMMSNCQGCHAEAGINVRQGPHHE
jgi:hypothetical protein